MKHIGIGAAALSALLAAACGTDHVPAPTVATAGVIRGTFTLEREGTTELVAGTSRVESGAQAATGEDGRGIVQLDSGAWILLDRASRLTVELAAVQLGAGRAWIDASNADEITVRTAHGSVRAANATFAVELGDGQARVYC
ncbi:MAG TPA: FecR domain-containing protein, partial [Sandaracinaceae bacterium]